MSNIDERTVQGFGEEWIRFNQSHLVPEERCAIFHDYFSLLPSEVLHKEAIGADIGCGSGRWAACVAPKVGALWAIDASAGALQVAERNLRAHSNVQIIQGDAGRLPLADESLDFAYSLGVLHHVPDTQAALVELARKMRDRAPVLLYLYYNFENRPWYFRAVWRITDLLRRLICRLPRRSRFAACEFLAAVVYWPMARGGALAERIKGGAIPHWPLRYYGDKSFYVMRTDALDRFGTKLEQRFSRQQIIRMMKAAGFEDVRFSDAQPHWTLTARKTAR
ncbi:MAG: class I SAM-dependent methyltransferase [Bacteriovoracia bacterium]